MNQRMKSRREKVKMIGLDLDGTLLNDKKEVGSYTEKVLKTAIDQGVVVLIATGRPVFGVPERLRSFPGMRYIITSNGARILDQKENRTVYEKMITKEETQRILYTLEQFDSLADLYFEEKALGCLKSKERVSEFYPENMQKYIFESRTFVPDLHEAVITAEKDIDKIQAVVRTTGERDRIMEVLKAKFDLTISCALSNNIEVTAKDVNKGKGLLNLGKILGISRAEIMAFGDGLNDMDMLKEAGFAVAMENGRDEVKEIADYITCSNEQEGVAYAIEKFVLNSL